MPLKLLYISNIFHHCCLWQHDNNKNNDNNNDNNDNSNNDNDNNNNDIRNIQYTSNLSCRLEKKL